MSGGKEGKSILFTALLKVREGSTTNERITRRAQYSLPEGCRPVSEYWLQTTDPSPPHVVASYETDSVEPVMTLLADWDDQFHITVAPSITSEDGLRAIERMTQADREQAWAAGIRVEQRNGSQTKPSPPSSAFVPRTSESGYSGKHTDNVIQAEPEIAHRD